MSKEIGRVDTDGIHSTKKAQCLVVHLPFVVKVLAVSNAMTLVQENAASKKKCKKNGHCFAKGINFARLCGSEKNCLVTNQRHRETDETFSAVNVHHKTQRDY